MKPGTYFVCFNRGFAFDVFAAVFPHFLTYALLQVNWKEMW